MILREFISLKLHKYLDEQFLNKKITIGKIYDEADVYGYTQRIHHTYDDFIDGDLGDRIESYEEYIVKEVNISDIDIDEFYVDDSLVDEYKEKIRKNGHYPPVVLNSDYSIIDGTHRINALNELGIKTVIAFVGVE